MIYIRGARVRTRFPPPPLSLSFSLSARIFIIMYVSRRVVAEREANNRRTRSKTPRLPAPAQPLRYYGNANTDDFAPILYKGKENGEAKK